MEIQFLGAHNSESKDTRLASLLIDDVLALDAGALTSTLSFSAQRKLRSILITHQHYDHTRDVPAIAMNALLQGTSIQIYSIPAVRDALATFLVNDKLYSDFFKRPEDNPTIKFTVVDPDRTEQCEGYSVLAAPVNHSVPAVGYQVTSPDNKSVFYTGDTGPDLADCWQHISPQLLAIEVTASNRYEEFARRAGHLTPGLLGQELNLFRKLKGYLPGVVTVHMNPWLEKEIAAEIAELAQSLDSPITLAHEGMRLRL